MKQATLLTAILFSISLSSFKQPEQKQPVFEIQSQGLFGEESCAVAVITSLNINGKDVTDQYYKYKFTFCPDQTMMASLGEYTVMGSWLKERDGVIALSMYSPSGPARDEIREDFPDLSWMTGTYRIIEHSEKALELERIDGGDYVRVRFEA
jgi:hypothetical protein